MAIKYPQLQDEKWLRKRVLKTPLRRIAKEIGSSYGAVMYTVNKFEIKCPFRTRKIWDDPAKHRSAVKRALGKKYPHGRFGELASNWKGGRRKSGLYILLYAPNHPHCTNEGYVMEHRLVMEMKLKRFLTPQEEVHHINGIKSDNRVSNLEVMSRKEHSNRHFSAVKEVARLKKILDTHGIKH